MAQLLLVLWASLVFVEVTGDMLAMKKRNLHCFQCDMVIWANQCQSMECNPKEKWCIIKEVLNNTGTHSTPVITKSCSINCPKFDYFIDWALGDVETMPNITCCAWNNCNRAPESLEGFGALLGRVLLTMGLGLFCTLLG
uniref:lymphocyte antigen 6L-like n=1 Tax=Arvicanthis niloticus TaxID=61156 RepID=UPI00148641A2|nr:lymphocyte antigen 6L-like [Arvicanthis niloticus]